MRNLGIALGNTASSAQSSFGNFVKLKRDFDEMQSETALRDAAKNAPKVGDVVPDTAAPAQIERERTTLGLPEFTPEINQEGRLAALREARTARGIQGDFSLAPERRFTQQDRDDFLQSRLQEMGTPRAIMMASQLRAQNSQSQLNELNLGRQQFETLAMRAAALMRAGRPEEAQAFVAAGFNILPNNMQGTFTRNEDGTYNATIISPTGQPVRTQPFANLQQAVDGMLEMSSPENFRMFAGQRFTASENAANRDNAIRTANISASATRDAAKLRADVDREQIAANSGYRAAQVESLTAQAAQLRNATQNDRELNERYNEFERLLTEDPTSPRVRQLAQRLYAQGGSRFVGTEERSEVVEGVPRTIKGEYNRLERMIQTAQPRAAAPEGLARIREDYRTGSAEKRAEIRRQYDATYGRGASNRDLGRAGDVEPSWMRAPVREPTQQAPTTRPEAETPPAPRTSALPTLPDGRAPDANIERPLARGLQAVGTAAGDALARQRAGTTAASFDFVWRRQQVNPEIAARAKAAAQQFPDLFSPEQREWLNNYTPPTRR